MRPVAKYFFAGFFWLSMLNARAQQSADADCRKQLQSLEGTPTRALAEIMPKYKNSDADVIIAIGKEIHYPKDQRDMQTKVYVGFVVDTLGQIRNACITKHFASTITPIEQEVLRALSTMKNWSPGKQQGKKVAVQYYMPIIIDLK